MPDALVGLHHVTSIASEPQVNLSFYTETLGLRFVKRTVNFDDPGTYHFYFGDERGSPGTILTFFLWPNVSRGTLGVGETSAIALSIPAESVFFWESRLHAAGVAIEREESRFGSTVLKLVDPDGMRLELVSQPKGKAEHPPRTSDVPVEYSIIGLHGVTLCESGLEATAAVLRTLGFWPSGLEVGRHRFSAPAQALVSHIDILVQPRLLPGRMGAGSVHHIAFRTPSDSTQLAWKTELEALDLGVTPVLDRTYFHSIYFREPGGVLFEVATDSPGFTLDESVESLGEELKLPAWLEGKRGLLEEVLPAIRLQRARAPS